MLKVKRIIILISFIIGILCAGCGEESPAEKINLGMISYLNASEAKMTEMLNKLEAERGEKLLPYETIYYDNLNSMLMDLNSGRLNEISTYKSVSYYLTARNKELRLAPNSLKLSDSFCCAFRENDAQLLAKFNEAIESMKSDGTLLNLTKKYITDLKDMQEPETKEMPEFVGAEKIKIAVTGDLPPLDLITSQGQPAGFNTAVLAEISNRLQKNFELVSIESGARAQALTSGVVDVLFWARIPDETDGRDQQIDKASGIEFTTPYYKDDIVHLARLAQ